MMVYKVKNNWLARCVAQRVCVKFQTLEACRSIVAQRNDYDDGPEIEKLSEQSIQAVTCSASFAGLSKTCSLENYDVIGLLTGIDTGVRPEGTRRWMKMLAAAACEGRRQWLAMLYRRPCYI